MNKLYKKITCITLTVILSLLPLSGCQRDEPQPEDAILSFPLRSDPLTLDPQIASDYSSYMLITNIFEGLVRTDSEGNVKAGMAESWDISDDKLSYTFHLFDNISWSNGTPVTADDFVFGITRALTPDTKAKSASDLFLIKNASAFYDGTVTEDMLGVKAIDGQTLQIDLEYESNALLNVLTEPVAMPCNEDFFYSAKGKYGKSDELTITNGPFKIRDTYGWDHDSYIYIRRNDEYHGANPAIPLGVNFNYTLQSSDNVNALLNGEADICEIYGNHLEKARESGLNITTTANTLWGICFNTDINAFKNAKLRVSLFSAADRDNILRNVPESYVKTTQLIDYGIKFAGLNYREQAGELLLEKANSPSAMYADAIGELDEKGISYKSGYTIIYLDDDASSDIVTSLIEAWNKTTGCYFNKLPLEREELQNRMESGNYEIAIAPLNTALDSPMEFLSKFTTDSTDNYINLNYPQYNEFINTALSESGTAAVDALMNAEEYLINYAYLYPLYYESRYFASTENVSGAVFAATGEAIDFTQVKKLTED